MDEPITTIDELSRKIAAQIKMKEHVAGIAEHTYSTGRKNQASHEDVINALRNYIVRVSSGKEMTTPEDVQALPGVVKEYLAFANCRNFH